MKDWNLLQSGKLPLPIFEKVLHGEIYSPLRDLDLFNQVKIDPEVFTIVCTKRSGFRPGTSSRPGRI